jgi:hypothetical protein
MSYGFHLQQMNDAYHSRASAVNRRATESLPVECTPCSLPFPIALDYGIIPERHTGFSSNQCSETNSARHVN